LKRSGPRSKSTKTEQAPKPDTSPKIVEIDFSSYEEDETREVVFKPNAGPQTMFLAASEREVLYGGSAGGGKSYAILADALRDLPHPQFRGLILRRTTEELRELVQKSQELYPKAIPGIKWSERKMEWRTPSGGSLWMSYLERDQDVTRYQGQAFNYIAFDELTQWPTPYAWNYMRSRLRTTAPDLKTYMRATTNPGGQGHCLPFGEVLTSSGWKDIALVKSGEEVLSVDKAGQACFKTVSDTIAENYSGVMINKKDQMVFTENHRLAIKTSSGVQVKCFTDLPGQCNVVRSAKPTNKGCAELFTVPNYPTRKTRLTQPDTVKYKLYAELMGWFLSEGYTLDRDKEFGICQCKEEQRGDIKNLLDACGFTYRISSTGFQINSPKWWSYFRQFGKSREKFIPRELLLSGQSIHTFNSLMAGDGHWTNKNNSGAYYTISKQLANDFLELCIRLGFSAKLSSRQRDSRNGLSYEISFNKRPTTELNTGNHIYGVATTNQGVNIEKSQFSGKVYCLTVPGTETFFVRQNGYVWLSGNSWVKKMFVDPSVWGKSFWATDIETGEVLQWPKGHAKSGPLFKRRFIPARLSDNPYLYESGDYEANLLSLPEAERKRLLEGDWDVMEGSAFTEWDRSIHVVEPFDIPHHWRKFRACDFGYSSFSGVLWFAVDPMDEKLIVYREMYVSKTLAQDLADLILQAETDDGPISYGVLDSSCWHQRGQSGPSIAELMINRGCRWRPSDRSKGSRVAGKNEVHRRLQIDEYTKEPRIVFFSNCIQTIAQIPMLPLDTNNPEDVNTKSEDHLYDALRYGIMSRPRSSAWDVNPETTKHYRPVCDVFGY
jgi:hypothetical protein